MKVATSMVASIGRLAVANAPVKRSLSQQLASISVQCLSAVRVAIFALVVTGQSAATAQQWPQWRGKAFDSVAEGQALPIEFGLDKNLLWKTDLPGAAGASPIVAGDRIFLTTQMGPSGLGMVCLSTSGELLWQHSFDRPDQSRRMDNANAASPSPVTDGKHVWAVMGTGEIRCLTVDGERVWDFDLQQELGKFKMLFGYATSPVLADGKLFVVVVDGDMRSRDTSEGKIICFDAKTGNKDWVHDRKTDGYAENLHSYASPIVCKINGNEMLLVHGADYLTAHALKDGLEVWRIGGLNPQGENYHKALRFVASPGIADGMLVVPSAKNGPLICVDLRGSTGTDASGGYSVVWQKPKGTPDVSTPLIYRGIVYLTTKNGLLVAHDLADGSQLYRERLLADKHRSTAVASDGKIYLVGRDGTVAVVKAGAKFQLLAKNELKQEATASPAIADGILYVRTWQALYAFGKKKK